MAANWKVRSALCLVVLALVGVIAFIANAAAQQDAKTPWLTAGFVRPSADGKVADGVENVFGGTIYYAVYQLPAAIANPSDPYNTGLADLSKEFVPGTGSAGLKSPTTLVPSSKMPKYLYLYQLVNDRGIDQGSKDGIKLAGLNEIKSRDIGSMVLKLPVEPSDIASWGYFKNAGFAIDAIDRGVTGKERPASLPAKTRMGVSANPSVLVKLHDMNGQGHNKMARPVPFKASSGFGVDKAGKNLTSSLFYEELNKPGIKPVAWQQDALKSAQTGGENPESVELISGAVSKDQAKTVLRASFANNPLKLGKNSVLIGFTSNIAPGQDLVRLQDVDATKKNSAIRTVSMDDLDFGAGGQIALPKPEAKEQDIALGAGKPTNLMVQGIVSPGDIPSNSKMVDQGTYKTFGGTVYFAVYRRTSTTGGDTWGVGRSDFDGLFSAGQSYRGGFSPRLDTDAEYLYLYQVVNDRGMHDLKLPQNKAVKDAPIPVSGELPDPRTEITREVASFSLFLRTDPRLITSWGYFDDAGFNVKVPNEELIKQVANDPTAKPEGMPMAVSSNISILETIYPKFDKVYKSWSPPKQIDFNKTTFGIGKDTLNITKNKVRAKGADSAGNYMRLVANRTLDDVAAASAIKPDYAQVLYFDGANPINGATIDGITLGPAEVARAVFKVDFLKKNITEGQHSVVFGFTSNVEPVRAPVRIKDLRTTINDSSEAQERTFLTPAEIKSLAQNAIRTVGLGTGTAPGVAPGTAPGVTPGAGIVMAGLNADADDAALAVANGLGQGILPAGLGTLARGSIGTGIAISPSVATPNAGATSEAGAGAGVGGMAQSAATTGATSTGGGFGGGGGIVGALGTARMPVFAGGGGGNGGSGGGSNQGSAGTDGTGQGQGQGTGQGTGQGNANVTVNNDFTISQNQQQSQNQWQWQKQNQSQKQNNGGGDHCCNNRGNVVPAPASLLLGLLGLPGLYFAYRRRRQTAAADEHAADQPAD